MKRIVAFLLILALLLPLAACGEDEKARPSSQASPSSSLETRSPSSEPEPEPEPGPGETSSQPAGEDAPLTGDALVREIIKTYGAEEVTGQDGVTRLVPTAVSLFYRQSSWDYGEELSGVDYYDWFLSTTFDEDPAYKEEHYAHPLGDGHGWFFPQDLFEERVQRYFRASSRQLRSGAPYDPQRQGYWLPISLGIGESAIEYSYTQDNGILTIDLSLDYSPRYSPYTGRLTVILFEEDQWEYLCWKCLPQTMPQTGKLREEVDFLTPEHWELLDKAMLYYSYFTVNGGSFYGDTSWQDPALSVEIDGVQYLKYTGTLYQGWDDFYQDICSVFTPEYFEQLNTVDFGLWGSLTQGPLYRNIDGDLYCAPRDGGGNPAYLPDADRYSVYRSGSMDKTLSITCRSYYCDREDVGKDDPVPTSFKDRHFILENGPDGWRVSRYARP